MYKYLNGVWCGRADRSLDCKCFIFARLFGIETGARKRGEEIKTMFIFSTTKWNTEHCAHCAKRCQGPPHNNKVKNGEILLSS